MDARAVSVRASFCFLPVRGQPRVLTRILNNKKQTPAGMTGRGRHLSFLKA